MQNSRDAARTDVQNQVRDVVRIRRVDDGQTPAIAGAPDAPPAPDAPVALGPIPRDGGRIIIQRDGGRTVITSASLPPQVMPLARMAQETALGLVGLFAAIIILGPFARMFARRMERKPELTAASNNATLLQHQLEQLQQSVDAMSLEVERIGESQRFQSKLLVERGKP